MTSHIDHVNRPRSTRQPCDWARCTDLRHECGEALFPMYSKNLLVRGWAGSLSPVEKAYRKAHAIVSPQAAARNQQAAERMGGVRSHLRAKPSLRTRREAQESAFSQGRAA